MSSKHQQLQDWLAANPGKTNRDWLLEARCTNDGDREAMSRLLDTLDKGGVKYGICVKRDNHYAKYQFTPLSEIAEVYFDVLIAPGVGKNSYLLEMDMPDEVLDQLTWNAKRTENIPEVAFRWLLGKWAPDFDINTLDEKQYHKLMWEDMGSLLGPFIGMRGFPNWKEADFGDNVVTKFHKEAAIVDALVKEKMGL